jgi:hypothetical protein
MGGGAEPAFLQYGPSSIGGVAFTITVDTVQHDLLFSTRISLLPFALAAASGDPGVA